MMRAAFLLACLAFVACSDAVAGGRSRSRRTHQNAAKIAAATSGVTDYLTGSYPWKVLWTGADTSYNSNGTWTDLGTDGVDITGASGAGTGGQSTSGLTLPASLTDKLVGMDANDTWDESGTFSGIADGQDYVIRAVWLANAAYGANRFLFRYNFGTTNIVQFRASSGTVLAFRAIQGTAEAEDTFNVAAYANAFSCMDIHVDVDDGTTDCGGSPCGVWTAWINGNQLMNAQTSAAVGALTGGGEWTVGSYTGGSNQWRENLLFLGLFEGTMDESTHDADMSGAGCF